MPTFDLDTMAAAADRVRAAELRRDQIDAALDRGEATFAELAAANAALRAAQSQLAAVRPPADAPLTPDS